MSDLSNKILSEMDDRARRAMFAKLKHAGGGALLKTGAMKAQMSFMKNQPRKSPGWLLARHGQRTSSPDDLQRKAYDAHQAVAASKAARGAEHFAAAQKQIKQSDSAARKAASIAKHGGAQTIPGGTAGTLATKFGPRGSALHGEGGAAVTRAMHKELARLSKSDEVGSRQLRPLSKSSKASAGLPQKGPDGTFSSGKTLRVARSATKPEVDAALAKSMHSTLSRAKSQQALARAAHTARSGMATKVGVQSDLRSKATDLAILRKQAAGPAISRLGRTVFGWRWSERMMRAVKTRLDAAAKAGDVPLAHSGKSGAVRDIAAKLRWSKTKPSSATKLGGKSAQAASFRDSLGSHLSPGERGRAIKKFLDKLHGG